MQNPRVMQDPITIAKSMNVLFAYFIYRKKINQIKYDIFIKYSILLTLLNIG